MGRPRKTYEDPFEIKEKVPIYIPKPVKLFLEMVAKVQGISLSSLCCMLLIRDAVEIKTKGLIIDPQVIELAKQVFKVEIEMIKKQEA